MDDLINEVKAILYGIDMESCDDDKGWWETSCGAEFGKEKLERVIEAIKKYNI